MENGKLEITPESALNTNKIEILAPAKDKETAIAAINCGADAVYIGAPAFGARKNASNSLEDIHEVINYAHKFWAKVYITINTILTDSELNEAVKLINKLSNIGTDAIIIQDMGLLNRLIKDNISSPTIHISTQCDNYLPQKVKFFNDIGVKRVILARELSVEQIKEIHELCPNLELESFIHGALCVSMSGQCYLSQYIGGRSANRGECAQPCRKQYDVIDDNGNIIAQNIYPLCLKDFNGSEYIQDLINAGICSFKIEGRLKDISYVKNIVSYYKNIIGKGTSSGRCVYPFTPNPEKTFNRGFTSYFLNGREKCFSIDSPKSKGEYLGKVIEVNKDYFVIQTDKEIHPQNGLYFNNDGCLVNRVINKQGNASIYPNKKVNISNGVEVYRNLDTYFEKELMQPVKRKIGIVLKLNYDNLTLTDEDGISVSAKISGDEVAKNPEKMQETFLKQFFKTGDSDFCIEETKIQNPKLPFMPVSTVNELRRKMFEDLMQKRLEVYENRRELQKPLKYTKYFLTNVDYRANIHNKSAKEFYEKCGVKVNEYSLETNLPKRQIELMRCKHCIKYALNMCKSPKKIYLKDLQGKIYPLKFDCKNCEMSVLSPN